MEAKELVNSNINSTLKIKYKINNGNIFSLKQLKCNKETIMLVVENFLGRRDGSFVILE